MAASIRSAIPWDGRTAGLRAVAISTRFLADRFRIRPGRATAKQVDSVRVRVEAIVSARMQGLSIDPETAAWLGSIGDALHARLAAAGLVESREKRRVHTLAGVLDAFFDRSTVKPAGWLLADFGSGDCVPMLDGPAGAAAPGGAVMVNLDSVQPAKVRWLWPGRLALGKPCLLAGPPGRGKSLLTLDIAARLSTGAGWPDMPDERREPAGTLLLSAEDDPADTILPRLKAAGGDPSFVRALEGVYRGNGKIGAVSINDPDVIARAIDETPRCRLVVVDPVSAYLAGKTDSHRDADVRSALMPLARVAADKGVALLLVMHLNKRKDGDSFARVGGSIAWTALARTAFLAADDPDDGNRRVLATIKSNISREPGSLAYEIASAGDDEPPFIRWIGADARSANDLLADGDRAGGERRTPVRDDAARFLEEELRASSEGVPVAELKTTSREAGHSWASVRRAKDTLGVEAVRRGGIASGGEWVWVLPEERMFSD